MRIKISLSSPETLLGQINDKLALMCDAFQEGVYSLYEKEACNFSDRFYTAHHK
ncbi:hypothetical protein [uncultured Helicobacter sp.]|uniref:hypothetical protein n=1 Tax=uncultured Helicobacter sp. TaxID=175537 RepID=UPI001C3AC34A|nr:hypothetical protein [Candidatus Helicobacter avicola]